MCLPEICTKYNKSTPGLDSTAQILGPKFADSLNSKKKFFLVEAKNVNLAQGSHFSDAPLMFGHKPGLRARTCLPKRPALPFGFSFPPPAKKEEGKGKTPL